MSRRSARKNAFYLLFQLGFTKSEEELLKQKSIFFQQIDEELKRKINEEEERIKLKRKEEIAEFNAKQTIERAIKNSIEEDEEDLDNDEIDLLHEEDDDLEESKSNEAVEEKDIEISNTFIKKRKFQEITPEDKEFILKLVDGAVENIFDIDETISDNANGWTAGRMARVDVTILRIAVFELMFYKETPVGVVINEAVELAKKFSSDEAPSFVNGILGSIVKNEI